MTKALNGWCCSTGRRGIVAAGSSVAIHGVVVVVVVVVVYALSEANRSETDGWTAGLLIGLKEKRLY